MKINSRLHILLFAVVGLLPIVVAQAQTESPQVQSSVTLGEVLVTGEHEGPRMWKVTKDGHVLWILGTYGPLPKKMTWRSQVVEEVIKDSQEVITSPTVTIWPGYVRGLFLLPKWNAAQKNPNNSSLVAVLPNELYARFAVQRSKYAPHDNSIEKLAPGFAAIELYAKATSAADLKWSSALFDTVSKIAKRYSVPVRVVTVKAQEFSPWINEIRDIPMAVHVRCLDATLTRLETDMTALRARANSWATGDVNAFRYLPHVDNEDQCQDMWLSHTSIGLRLNQQRWPLWFAAIDEALNNNRSTFAFVPMSRLFDPDGPLAVFRAKGYVVEEP